MRTGEIQVRKVHLRGRDGLPACGYHRWSSQIITTTTDTAQVTCRRLGCRQGNLAWLQLYDATHRRACWAHRHYGSSECLGVTVAESLLDPRASCGAP